jgi:gamma-tubulin complex component 5
MDEWIANVELAFVRGTQDSQQVSTPTSLRLDFDKRFGTMLDHLSSVLPYTAEPVHLLNALHAIMSSTDLECRGPVLKIFITTATPLWETLGDWLNRGMPIPRSLIDIESRSEAERTLDDEFWIYRDQDVSWADEDFWDAAFVFKDILPDWIEPDVLEATLEAGKARGLLRGLLGASVEGDDEESWITLGSLLGLGDGEVDIADSIGAYLSPNCQLTTVHLRRVLDEECGLQAHLDAVDGLLYMRGIDVLQPWAELLFSQVSPRPPRLVPMRDAHF